MTQEEKVVLLKEAGVWDVIGYPTCIDKLFELVAAHEREACANVCEENRWGNLGAGCAAAIRARNSHEKTN